MISFGTDAIAFLCGVIDAAATGAVGADFPAPRIHFWWILNIGTETILRDATVCMLVGDTLTGDGHRQ